MYVHMYVYVKGYSLLCRAYKIICKVSFRCGKLPFVVFLNHLYFIFFFSPYKYQFYNCCVHVCVCFFLLAAK